MGEDVRPGADPVPAAGTQPDGISRRSALGLGALAAAGLTAASALGRPGAARATTAPVTPQYPIAPQGSTLDRTLLHGTPDASGYRRVVTGAGEPSLVRSELLGGASRGSGSRTAVVALAQLTDMHIIDAQSPARVEFLDRLVGTPLGSSLPFDAAYRAQEMLTAHVAEAMVQSLNSLAGGPVTGRPIDFAISTGDNADNTQYNEVRWHVDLLDGRQAVRPDSGNYTKWEGVGGKGDYDTAYWHPDGTPLLGTPDDYRAKYGFPTVPGLLDRCRAPFRATGLAMPWYAVFGNHDGLVQGNVPSLGLIGAIATGALKPSGLPLGVDVGALLARIAAGDASALQLLLTLAPAKLVTPDANRRMLTRQQTVAEYFRTTGTPIGHGYTRQNLDGDTAYYAFDQGPVRCISLDTVNLTGYADGSLDSAQFGWLERELKANSSRYLDTNGNWVTGSGTDRLIVLFSHHTIATMGNLLGVDRVSGTQVEQLLLRFPNVVAWVNGHTHRNQVLAHARPSGAAAGGGFWEINTASHVDWPQQSRTVEIVDNGDGTLSIFTTIVDHAAPVDWPASPRTPLELAALSRELGINDPQRATETSTEDGKRGALSDRNTELLLRAPFPLSV
jgi:metallophosphoesterase (TIGR03767 family)